MLHLEKQSLKLNIFKKTKYITGSVRIVMITKLFEDESMPLIRIRGFVNSIKNYSLKMESKMLHLRINIKSKIKKHHSFLTLKNVLCVFDKFIRGQT